MVICSLHTLCVRYFSWFAKKGKKNKKQLISKDSRMVAKKTLGPFKKFHSSCADWRIDGLSSKILAFKMSQLVQAIDLSSISNYP